MYIRKADKDAAIEAFGKNDQIKRVILTLFIAMAGLVLARVVDPVKAQQVMGIITGMGGKQEKERCIISFPTHIGFF